MQPVSDPPSGVAHLLADLVECPVAQAPSRSFARRARRFKMAFLAGASCVRRGAPGLTSECAYGQKQDELSWSVSISQVSSTAGAAVGQHEEGLFFDNLEENTPQTRSVFQPMGDQPTAGTGGARSGEQFMGSSDGHAMGEVGKNWGCTGGSLHGGAGTSALSGPSALRLSLGFDAPASSPPNLEASEVLAGNVDSLGAQVAAVDLDSVLDAIAVLGSCEHSREGQGHNVDAGAINPLDFLFETMEELSSCVSVQEKDGWVSIDRVFAAVGQALPTADATESIHCLIQIGMMNCRDDMIKLAVSLS